MIKGNFFNKIDSYGVVVMNILLVVGFNIFNLYINNIYGVVSCINFIIINF